MGVVPYLLIKFCHQFKQPIVIMQNWDDDKCIAHIIASAFQWDNTVEFDKLVQYCLLQTTKHGSVQTVHKGWCILCQISEILSQTKEPLKGPVLTHLHIIVQHLESWCVRLGVCNCVFQHILNIICNWQIQEKLALLLQIIEQRNEHPLYQSFGQKFIIIMQIVVKYMPQTFTSSDENVNQLFQLLFYTDAF